MVNAKPFALQAPRGGWQWEEEGRSWTETKEGQGLTTLWPPTFSRHITQPLGTCRATEEPGPGGGGGKDSLLHIRRAGASEPCRVQGLLGRRCPVGEPVNEAGPAGQDVCKNFPSRSKG